MITGAQLAPFRDRLKALIAAQQPPPVIVPGNEPPLSAMEMATNLTTTTFFDHFDDESTIDRESVFTMQPPHKWASWYWGDAKTGITMQDSVLRIAHDPGNGGGNVLATMAGKDGVINGWGFTGSAAISCAMACDPSTATPGSRSWPAFWSLAKEHVLISMEQKAHQNCARVDGSSPMHMEFDFVELGFPFPILGSGESILFAFNFWGCNIDISRKYPTCDWNGVVMNNPSAETRPAGFDFKEMNVYTTVYLHPNDNNGTSSIKRYITRPGGTPFHVANCDQSWQAGAPMWSLVDQQTYPLIVGAGAGFPAEFDWVCVRQAA